MSLSDFGIRVIVASENELGSTSTSIFCKSLWRMCHFFLKCWREFTNETNQGWCFGRLLITLGQDGKEMGGLERLGYNVDGTAWHTYVFLYKHELRRYLSIHDIRTDLSRKKKTFVDADTV